MTATTDLRTIIVPLDGSTFAEQALPLALSLAQSLDHRLLLVHAHQITYWPDEIINPETLQTMERLLHEEGETYLRDVQRRYQAPGVTIDSAILSGELIEVGQALSLCVQERRAALVVMATHGRGGFKRAWLGSVADYLVRHLVVPVVLVHPDTITDPASNRILVPLDGSPLSETAIDQACAIAAATRQEVVLLRVIPPVRHPIGSLDSPNVGYDMELTAWERAQADDYLDELTASVRERGLKCSGLTMLANTAAEGIIDMARPAHFSLIAIATHGRGGLRRLMLGSVADKVIRAASVPVLVIRPMMAPVPATLPPSGAKLAGPRSCTI